MENKTCGECEHFAGVRFDPTVDRPIPPGKCGVNDAAHWTECPARTKERELRKVLHLARELLAKIPVPTEWIVEVGPVLEDITQALKGE